MTELKSLRLLPEILKLKEILVPATRIYEYDELEGHCVTVDDLSGNPFKFESVSDDFALQPLDKSYAKLTQSVLLISLADGLKFSFCTATVDNPIFVEGDVLAYRIERHDIHIGYLVYQLSLKLRGVDIEVPEETFLSIAIEFPSFKSICPRENQEGEYKLALREYRMKIAQEYDLQEMIDDMKREYINEVRMRKHDMGSHLSELAAIRRRMKTHLGRMGEPGFECKMKELVDAYSEVLNRLFQSVDLLACEEFFGVPERINIDGFLYDYSMKKPEHNEEIDYDRSRHSLEEFGVYVPEDFTEEEWEESQRLIREGHFMEWLSKAKERPYRVADAYVDIASEDLRTMLDIIIDNARLHGFSNDDSYKNIFIQLCADASRQYLIIDIFNNGKPLPHGMDKERYGLKGEKAGENAHTGLGGYRVKSIVEHYSGDYNIENVYDEEGLHAGVSVKLYLPIAK